MPYVINRKQGPLGMCRGNPGILKLIGHSLSGALLYVRLLLFLLRLAEQLDLSEARADELAVGGVRLEDADL